jgi:hypothetical protein
MTEAWKLWRDGGKVSYSNDWYNIQFTGVNEMLTKMRAAGSQNPIIVQGLWTFEGFPTNVIDPSNKLIYAMHPFLNVELDLLDWDTIFGDFARSNAFLVTAWSATTSTNEGWCQSCGFETAGDFLEYIDVRDIGLLAYAVDVPWSMATHFTNSVIDVRGFSTTNCTEWGNAGELMTNYIISSQIDTNPPAMPWIPPSISTNAPNYYVWFNLSSNSFAAGDTGFWSTNNGSTWSPYTNGTSFMVYSSVTLRVYARDLAGNKSATNTATYIIDTVAPDIWYWLPSLTTNKAFYHYFDVSENYGEWSTNNGVTWSQFTTNGWGRTFSNATTLIMRGHDVAGNFSATNAATYTFDTNAPVVGNWKASFTTNTSHYIWINISENYGYWSTNSGANWNRYTNGTGAGFWFTNTATLWAYGLDVAGNYSATNKATYTIIR